MSEKMKAVRATNEKLSSNNRITDEALNKTNAADFQIKDVNMAKEMMRLTTATIKQQEATTVLSMHMQNASNVLKLLR